MKRSPIRNLTTTTLFSALLCIFSPIAVPVGAVPFTLSTFFIYLAAMILGKRAWLAVCIYTGCGMVGLPVFSGGVGGFGVLFSPTGGFVVGYAFCALVTGLLVDRFPENDRHVPLYMALGTAILYIFGTVWYMVLYGTAIVPALVICVLPFLPFDAVKICAAYVIGKTVKKKLKKEL